MKKPELIPAILVKDRKDLIKELKQVGKDVKTVQIDIMDGKFVRNKTIQPEDFIGIKKKLKYEIQLMVKNPLYCMGDFDRIGADLIIFHLESTKNKKEVLGLIKDLRKRKMKVGMGLNVKTKAEKVKPYLKFVDHILVMTVPVGKGGQKFMPSMLKKVEKIRKWNKGIDIEVDGGINTFNIHKCVEAGANKLVVGSAIFRKKDIHKAIKDLKANIKKP